MKLAQNGLLWLLKGMSGLILAYVVALIGREILDYGLFSFLFILLSVTGAFFYLVKGYKFTGLLVVDSFLAVMAFSLRWYVVIAYGS